MNKNFENPELSVNIKKANDIFITITLWVAHEIVNEPILIVRLKLLTNFILLCETLLFLKNFNGLMTIFAGLSQFSVSRLKITWANLTPNTMNKWTALENFMNPIGNFTNLRQIQMNTDPPSVPCLSLLFHDLVMIEDGNPEYMDQEKKFLNFEKALILGKTFINIKEMQKVNYSLSQVDLIQIFLRDLHFHGSEQNLVDLSKEIEPILTDI